MAVIKPFQCIRPAKEVVSQIAALPYDVYNRKEAKEVVSHNPLSFLKIDRAETLFPDDQDMYAPEVYKKARDTFQKMIAEGSFLQDPEKTYYLYEQTMTGRSQTGLVACASIDDYLSGTIRRHESTREEKELDRIRHVDTMSAQTGPIFLTCRPHPDMRKLSLTIKTRIPLYDFVSDDQIRHRVWRIGDPGEICRITEIFEGITHLYIADGHHRAASAVKVGQKRREAHPDYTGTEEFNYFLSVIFPSDELQILDYNRVISDLNGNTPKQLLEKAEKVFDITPAGPAPYAPKSKGEFGLYTGGQWYCLKTKPAFSGSDPIHSLDVSVLQDHFLEPVLGILDPKTDPRITFIGGIHGRKILQDIVDRQGDGAAFSLYPTSMEELLCVADAGLLMPPKSTWFEPKLRSGIFIHTFEP